MLRRSAFFLDLSGGPVHNLHGRMRGVIQPTVSESLLLETAAARERIARLHDLCLSDADADPSAPSYKPALPREWVQAPVSRLSTAASRRDWFRLMQFNVMVDAWGAEGVATGTNGTTGTTGTNGTTGTAGTIGTTGTTGTNGTTGTAGTIGTTGTNGTTGTAGTNGTTGTNGTAGTTGTTGTIGTIGTAVAGDRGRGATPVHGVQPRVPGFARRGADPDAFFAYDPRIDPSPPPYLSADSRRAYIVQELRHHDPDIVCLQEVNRAFFDASLWRHVRYWGYGALYQSSRGHEVRALRRGDDPQAPRHNGKISPHEDIGNVVLFHKGRFVPILMPGRDLAQRTHFAHIVAMRDKVTNMTLNVACVQFTAGDSAEAAETRLHEARQTLKLLDALTRHDADRAHMSNIICGDMNNTSDEEPCVELIRERLFSAYDAVGGPRWTAWFHEDREASRAYRTYAERNHRALETSDGAKAAAREAAKFARVADTAPNLPWIKQQQKQKQKQQQQQEEQREVGEEPREVQAPPKDALALQKESMREKGIVCRTQDFIFYDPRSLALHKVLDVPDDRHIVPEQLLPCTSHPSHHIHLVVDVSFTDTFPDVGEKSLKD